MRGCASSIVDHPVIQVIAALRRRLFLGIGNYPLLSRDWVYKMFRFLFTDADQTSTTFTKVLIASNLYLVNTVPFIPHKLWMIQGRITPLLASNLTFVELKVVVIHGEHLPFIRWSKTTLKLRFGI